MPGLLPLRPFAPAPGAVRAAAARDGGTLALRFEVLGAPDVWRVPAASARPERRDRLWESTCFEAFLAPAGEAAYWEINLAPSGDWNVYRFDGYRTGMRPEARTTPAAIRAVTTADGGFALDATLDLRPLDALATAALDVAIAAVLASTDGGRSYWALRHTGGAPDFHARDAFVLRLAA